MVGTVILKNSYFFGIASSANVRITDALFGANITKFLTVLYLKSTNKVIWTVRQKCGTFKIILF